MSSKSNRNCPGSADSRSSCGAFAAATPCSAKRSRNRHITNLDNMASHGINLVGFYIQGANAGWPNPEAGLNGFTRDGRIKPEVARRLERLVREPDRREWSSWSD